VTLQPPPIVREHEGVAVVRDDLFAGGTKARFLPLLFEGCAELVYASPAEGGAQTAMATVAQQLGKQATIFVAKRKQPHDRALMAKRLGATIFQVSPGYLTTVQARARQYVEVNKHRPGGICGLQFGLEAPGMRDVLVAAARSTGLSPRWVWCAAGSGFLASALLQAWPKATICRVRVGRALELQPPRRVETFVAPERFEQACRKQPPFPSDPHYDAKAWAVMQRIRREDARWRDGCVFWNVTGPALP
jgi:hypothetical protein